MSELAKQMWGAYAIQAGGKTFDGKPLPNWDELGEDRQACWAAAAKVSADRIEQLEAALRIVMELSRKRSTHPMSPEADYFCIAGAALEGQDGQTV